MGRFISMGHAPTTVSPRPAGQHGTHDTQGRWHPQLVHLGRTRGGTPGLFTGSMLAWPISDSDYWAFSSCRPTLKAYAEARGFTLEPQNRDD